MSDTKSVIIAERNDLFGREKIFVSLAEDELTMDNIIEVLPDVLERHRTNASQIKYLREQVRGKQVILAKDKKVRDNINNIVVENHLSHVISFNKGYVFGDPVQYVQVSDEFEDLQNADKPMSDITKDLNRLNTFMRNNSKASKDLDLVDDILTAGVCPRIIMDGEDKELAPFEFYNLKPEQAFVAYSNGIKGQALFSVYLLVKRDYANNEDVLYLDVRTRKNKFRFKMPNESYINGDVEIPQYIGYKNSREQIEKETNLLGEIPIVEYEFNKYRISLVEYILSAQNALNKITSADIDDIEQFVQAYMVLINADIDMETLEEVKAQGAISVKSTQDLDANVKMLTSKMSHSETKVLYERIYNSMLVNAGVPLINTSSGGGDTGLARLADNGWLMADTKAREKELSFIESEKPFLKMVLNILDRKGSVKELVASNIETKFTRNKSDNILTKAQALTGMQGIVHPEIAFASSGMFTDPSEAYTRSSEFYGENFFNPGKANAELANKQMKVDDLTEEKGESQEKDQKKKALKD